MAVGAAEGAGEGSALDYVGHPGAEGFWVEDLQAKVLG